MEKSMAVLRSLQTGDPQAINAYVSGTTYIQHNLAFPSGRQALLDALPQLAQAGTRVNIARTFRDGSDADFVVLHTDYTLFGARQIGFDVFRFDQGLIVEHWDNLQAAAAAANPSGHTMIDGATEIRDPAQTEANKTLVRDLISNVFIGGQFNRLPEYISTTTYIQHNSQIGDGLEGLAAAGDILAQFQYQEIFKVLGQGNFVVALSRIQFNGQDAAVYDMFRVDAGKIVEHWDVLQLIPPPAEQQNSNGKF